MEQRSKFSGRLGFVLAAAGSAVGLGNIWRFPYLAAKYGGGAFLLTYIVLVVTLGFTLMVTEIAIGRKTGLSPIGAYRSLNKKSSFIGVLGFAVAMLILPYYSVIGGWVIKYLITFITGQHIEAAGDAFFSGFTGQTIEPIVWMVLYLLLTLVVVLRGVKDGIEKASKFLMPILVVLSIAIAIYSMTLPGAMEGVKYLFIPNFSNYSVETVLAAMGQMFYSLSLAMGIMITYGSYLKKEDNLEQSVRHIEVFDTGIATLAAMMIIPAIFSFSGGDPSMLNQGPGLMFVTLPKVFASMPMGRIVGILFFLLVLFAALTSSISLMEAGVSTICDETKKSRKKVTIWVGIFAILMGIPSSLGNGVMSGFKILGMDFLTFMDFLTNSVMMPIGALLTCVFVGFVLQPKGIIEEVELSAQFRRKRMYSVIIKYIAPLCILAILISSVLNSLGIITL